MWINYVVIPIIQGANRKMLMKNADWMMLSMHINRLLGAENTTLINISNERNV